ncbi:hypothetical protein HYC85_009280 [Camellia sinensis]|uniref:Uncharacterized protein n=1 Tax=Camellia sinensis TaxID=4442 RepID=A0A7J7HHF5_CAMSI|nr:hypothetical protein HYC85_009280 [Camellia sinensis]
MERESIEDGQITRCLLAEEKPQHIDATGGGGGEEDSGGDEEESGGSSSSAAVTAVVVLSTFVAVSGSFAYGFASGYSSPAESGIMADLGLSTADKQKGDICCAHEVYVIKGGSYSFILKHGEQQGNLTIGTISFSNIEGEMHMSGLN